MSYLIDKHARVEEMYEQEFLDEVKDYLEYLHWSGKVNMFGATPYLQKKFGLSETGARELLLYWMHHTYNS